MRPDAAPWKLYPGDYGWFGESWPSGLCDDPDAKQLPTPVGVRCGYCGEQIEDGDRGVVYLSGVVQHRECSLRSVVGSLAHVERRCSCFVPGADETDPPELTRRQAAFAVWEWVQEHGQPT